MKSRSLKSGLSRMQLDESTDVANVDLLLVYIRYAQKNLKWELQGFVQPR